MNPRRDCVRLAFAVAAAGLLLAGCGSVSSTARRSTTVVAGAAVGGGAGYLLGDHAAGPTLGGAVAGAGLTHLALGADPEVRQAGFDLGYVQGQSDAIKRQYFLRQAREREPLSEPGRDGQSVYYTLPGPEVTVDGRKLAPHPVTIRVIE